jgi:hypothetical protein
MCELGFYSLSTSYCTFRGESTVDMDHTVPLFSVLYSGKVDRVVSMVMVVVESGKASYAWSISNISDLQSIPLCCTVHQLGESDY